MGWGGSSLSLEFFHANSAQFLSSSSLLCISQDFSACFPDRAQASSPPPLPIFGSAALLGRRPFLRRRKSGEPRGRRRLHALRGPHSVCVYTPNPGPFPPAAAVLEAPGWRSLARQRPFGVAGECEARGEGGLQASDPRAVLRGAAPGLLGSGWEEGAGGLRNRRGRQASPQTPGLGGGTRASSLGRAPCGFRPKPPPPRSPPQRCLRALCRALGGRRGKRGRDRGTDVDEPEGAAPSPRRVAGQPEGQRHLRAGGRCFLAARGRAGRPRALPLDGRTVHQQRWSPGAQRMAPGTEEATPQAARSSPWRVGALLMSLNPGFIESPRTNRRTRFSQWGQ